MMDRKREHWRYLADGYQNGATHMAVDKALSKFCSDTRPVLRVYGWQPPAISIGFHQDVDALQMDTCRRHGIDVVRRPTGGGAIFHAHEVTYSVIVPRQHPLFAQNSLAIYNAISAALVNALTKHGIRLQRVTHSDGLADFNDYVNQVACFATSANYEIKFRGRKLVGSAQRRFKKAVLQHGSIILGPQHLRLVDYLSFNSYEARRQLTRNTTCMEAILGRPVTFEEIAGSLRLGFEQHFGINLIQDELTDAERRIVQHIKHTHLAPRRTAS